MKKNYVFPVKSNLLSLFSGFLCSFFVFVLINFKSSRREEEEEEYFIYPRLSHQAYL